MASDRADAGLIEGKYEQQFHYISYAPGDSIEQEHLKVYPEQGDESDVVTVYRTYENGMYRYEDDYGAILTRPAYEEQIRTFAEQYLPSEGIKIYTEIKSGGSRRGRRSASFERGFRRDVYFYGRRSVFRTV